MIVGDIKGNLWPTRAPHGMSEGQRSPPRPKGGTALQSDPPQDQKLTEGWNCTAVGPPPRIRS